MPRFLRGRLLSRRPPPFAVNARLMPRVLLGHLLSPAPQLPLPASIGSFKNTPSPMEEFSWSEGSLIQPRPKSGERFREIHPTAPSTVGSYLNMREFRIAVRANDITLLLIKRSVPKVGILPTMQAKLAERPDLKPIVDWCMEWIRTTRYRAVWTPCRPRNRRPCRRCCGRGSAGE
jgi:hypothetical protein